MSLLEIIMGIVILVLSVVTVIVCLSQDQKSQDSMSAALTGASTDSFYGQHEGSAYERYAEGRLQRDIYLMERDKLNAENINELVATRGMAGMLNTIWLILCAMCFGSCMVASGMLHAITHVLLKSIHSTISLVCRF